MGVKLQNNLQNKKWYWKTRQRLKDGLVFVLWKRYFSLYYFGDEGKKSVGLLRGSLGSLIEGLLYAGVSIVAFEYLNHLVPATDVLKYWGVAVPFGGFDTQAIDSFLTTVASVSGVFLALYFASISSVAGNLLMSAPDKVRELYLEEREGSQYIRTLVLTGVISAFYLVFKSAGYTVDLYSLVFLLLLTIYNIAVFRKLGKKLFSLRSSEGASTITGEIGKSIKNATRLWKNKNKPFAQNHFSTRATYYLETFKQFIDFGSKGDLFSLEQMRQFARYAGGLLIFYLEYKRRIPTTSLWFKSKRQHKKWILTGSTEIILALNSGTGLSPTEIRDHIWFEKEVVSIIKTLQQYFLKSKDADSVVVGIEVYVQIFENGLANNLSVEESAYLFEQLRVVEESIYKSELSKNEQVMIADSDGRVAIGALLGFVRYIDPITTERVEKIFSKEKIKSGNIYDGSIPQSMLARAEELKSNLKNEDIIDGKGNTTDWYIKTTMVFSFLTMVKKYFEHLKTLHQSYFELRIDAFVASGDILIASQLTQRWLEFCSKYQMCVSVVGKTFDKLASHNKQTDFDWPSFNLEDEQNQAEEFQKRAIDKMTRTLPQLGSNPTAGEDLPDYFGQAFTFGVEACYRACEDNDFERFKSIFPSVFVGSIVAFNTTRDDTKGWLEQSQIIFSSEPLTDLIEISGYAKLYSELYQNPELWNLCKFVWEKYLSQDESDQIVRLIVSSTAYRKGLLMIMPKGVLRTNWEIAFRSKLLECGLITEDEILRYRDRSETVDHPSKLIRVIIQRGILPVHPEDIFFITYLKHHPRARDIDFPEDQDSIEERLNEDDANDAPQQSDENA